MLTNPLYEGGLTRQLENLLNQLEKREKWFLLSPKHPMKDYLSDSH